jgi:SAM-dependent methyltransferase
MSHPQQLEFVKLVKERFPSFFVAKRVLEIGSLDVNGSVRPYFSDCDYVGIDVGPGPGVDIVCQGQEFEAPKFDVVISCNCFEHNPFWKETFENMLRLCKPGGIVITTCASLGFPEHGTTITAPRDSPLTLGLGWDYYRNLTARDFRRAIKIGTQLSRWMFCSDLSFCDLFFVGFKTGEPPPASVRVALRSIRLRYAVRNLRRWSALRKRLLILMVGEQRYMAGPLRPRILRRNAG